MQVCIVCGLNSLIAAASWTSLDEIFHLQSVHFPSLQGNTSRSHYVGASSEVKLRSFLSILSGVCVTAVKHVTSKWREKLFAVRRSEVYFCFTSVASCKGPAGRNLLSRAGKACKSSLTCSFVCGLTAIQPFFFSSNPYDWYNGQAEGIWTVSSQQSQDRPEGFGIPSVLLGD